MTNDRRNRVPGATYFFTVNLLDRRSRLLTDEITLLREAARTIRRARPFHIDACVILPDHMHCLWTLPEQDTDYATRIRLLKTKFSKAIIPTETLSASRVARNFRLLANDLSELFAPDIVIFVEGDIDKLYLERVLNLKFPSSRLVVEACGGDIAARLSYWTSSLGDIQISPYRARTLVVFDKVKQAGLAKRCRRSAPKRKHD